MYTFMNNQLYFASVTKLIFHGGHLGFPIGTILSIFDLLVTPMLHTKFRVNWLSGLGGDIITRNC